MTMPRATSVTVGGLSWVWNRLTPPRWQRRRDVAVGALAEAQDAVAGLLARIQRRATDIRTDAALRATAATEGVRDRIDDLADIGAYEARLAEQRAAAVLDRLVTAIVASPALDRVVDAQLDRTVRPLLVTVLDDVLAALESDPNRLRPIIRSQRESMVDDLVERIRTGAAAGDARFDRMTSRVLRRPEPASGQRPEAAPE